MPKSNEELLADFHENEERLRELRKETIRLTERRETLLFCLRTNGMTYPAIAKEIGVTPARVFELVKRFREKLVADLKDDDDSA